MGDRVPVNKDLILLPILGHEKVSVIGRLVFRTLWPAHSSWESEGGVSCIFRNVIKSFHHKCGVIIQE